jgi:hypothetical protein
MTFVVLMFLVLFCLPLAAMVALQPAASVVHIAAMIGGAALLFATALLLPALLRRILARRPVVPSGKLVAGLDWPATLTRSEMELCCTTWLRSSGWQVTLQQEPGEDATDVYLVATRAEVRAAVLCDRAGESLNPASVRAFALAAGGLQATHLVLLTLTRGRLPPPAESAAARAGVLLLHVADLPRLDALAPSLVPA